MTGLDITVDDGSPLITFEPPGAWTQHNRSTDEIANNFYGGTYTQTASPGATISFTFEGVGVAIYGSRNVDHGNYTVTVDGRLTYASGQGTTKQPIQFQTLLFQTRTLPPRIHTLTILNQNAKVFDIDYITWTSKINQNKDGQLVRLAVDDAEPAFHFQIGAWSTTPTNLSSFFRSTGHVALKRAVSFNFSFTGDAVSLFGVIGPGHSPYTVQLDDQPPTPYSAAKTTYAFQTLLFYGSNLGGGNHVLHVASQADGLLEIDYAEVYTLPLSLNNTIDPAQTSSNPSMPGHTSRLSPGVIAGISVGGAIALILVSLVIFCACFVLKKKRQGREWERSTVQHRYMYKTPPSSAMPTNRSIVSLFRPSVSRQSSATLGSPGSPMSEVRKPSAPEFGPIIQAPATVTSPTPMREDGSNILVNQRERRSRRKSNPEASAASTRTRASPPATTQRTSVDRNERPPEYSLTPITPTPEVRESLHRFP